MTGAAIAIGLGFCLLLLAWRQRYHINTGKRINPNNRNIRPQHSHLERKLLKLLGGKHKIANRLIQQSRLKHPDKSIDWHWEKAIYDLERDRWR
jgi:phosphatidylserine/phosphatidylglycerophosphate/cardiolipin synthase-like enzyme